MTCIDFLPVEMLNRGMKIIY